MLVGTVQSYPAAPSRTSVPGLQRAHSRSGAAKQSCFTFPTGLHQDRRDWCRCRVQPRPAHVVVYDCADCQTFLGTASRVVVATVLGKFRLTRGEPKSYVETARTANSRADVCGVCGSPIYSAPPGPQPKVVALGVGTLLQCAELIPSHQFWCRSSVRWLPQLGSVDGFATQPVSYVTGGFVPE
ncbi:GFA family protein [Bradyrhizobium sp. USDA 377]